MNWHEGCEGTLSGELGVLRVGDLAANPRSRGRPGLPGGGGSHPALPQRVRVAVGTETERPAGEARS